MRLKCLSGAKTGPQETQKSQNFYGRVLPFPSAFQKTCIDGKPSEQRLNRLLGLWFQFPEHWLIKKYYDDYEKWEPACNGAAQAICKNTYIIKEQIIFTYPTVACKNREVTREDIENDIFLLDSNAEKLKHSTLLDEIEICQKAHNSDFYWSYEEPKASDKCKKEVPQTPKKKK